MVASVWWESNVEMRGTERLENGGFQGADLYTHAPLSAEQSRKAKKRLRKAIVGWLAWFSG